MFCVIAVYEPWIGSCPTDLAGWLWGPTEMHYICPMLGKDFPGVDYHWDPGCSNAGTHTNPGSLAREIGLYKWLPEVQVPIVGTKSTRWEVFQSAKFPWECSRACDFLCVCSIQLCHGKHLVSPFKTSLVAAVSVKLPLVTLDRVQHAVICTPIILPISCYDGTCFLGYLPY